MTISPVYDRALPTIDADNEEFWRSCKRHDMHLQRCATCRNWRYFPASVCPDCSSFDFSWDRVSGWATLFTFSTIYRPPSPSWADSVPYTYAVVELDEGPFMPTNIVGIAPDEIRIGIRLRLVYDDVTSEVTLPKFEPIGGQV
jgi:uncharacterized OB-fold protein